MLGSDRKYRRTLTKNFTSRLPFEGANRVGESGRPRHHVPEMPAQRTVQPRRRLLIQMHQILVVGTRVLGQIRTGVAGMLSQSANSGTMVRNWASELAGGPGRQADEEAEEETTEDGHTPEVGDGMGVQFPAVRFVCHAALDRELADLRHESQRGQERDHEREDDGNRGQSTLPVLMCDPPGWRAAGRQDALNLSACCEPGKPIFSPSHRQGQHRALGFLFLQETYPVWSARPAGRLRGLERLRPEPAPPFSLSSVHTDHELCAVLYQRQALRGNMGDGSAVAAPRGCHPRARRATTNSSRACTTRSAALPSQYSGTRRTPAGSASSFSTAAQMAWGS